MTVGAYLTLLYRESLRRGIRDRELLEEETSELREQESKVAAAGANIDFESLWAVTQQRIDVYREIATRQARNSFRSVQIAAYGGFLFLSEKCPAETPARGHCEAQTEYVATIPAVSLVLEVVEDFDAAVERAAEAPDLRMMRRAIREALGHLYTLREHRKSTVGEAKYYLLAYGSSDGGTVEALVQLRAALTHQVAKPVTPEYKDLHSDIYSDRYGVLAWLERSEMTDPPKSLKADYDEAVGGKNVYTTLHAARRFLVEPDVLGTLS